MTLVAVPEEANTPLDAPELPHAVKSEISDMVDDGDEGEDDTAVNEGALCLFS